MDGDLFTITWSPELLSNCSSLLDLNTEGESTETDSEPAQSTTQMQIPEYLPRFLEKVQSNDYFRRLLGPLEPPREEDLLEIANCV
jgi:hypothetical protein